MDRIFFFFFRILTNIRFISIDFFFPAWKIKFHSGFENCYIELDKLYISCLFKVLFIYLFIFWSEIVSRMILIELIWNFFLERMALVKRQFGERQRMDEAKVWRETGTNELIRSAGG